MLLWIVSLLWNDISSNIFMSLYCAKYMNRRWDNATKCNWFAVCYTKLNMKNNVCKIYSQESTRFSFHFTILVVVIQYGNVMKQDTRGSLKNMEALLETLSIRKASQIQSKAVIIVFSCNMSSSVPQVKCRVTHCGTLV